MNNISKDELTDVIGQNLESLIALLVGLGGELKDFSVANQISIAGVNYRYQFVVGCEGGSFYSQLEQHFRDAGLVE